MDKECKTCHKTDVNTILGECQECRERYIEAALSNDSVSFEMKRDGRTYRGTLYLVKEKIDG